MYYNMEIDFCMHLLSTNTIKISLLYSGEWEVHRRVSRRHIQQKYYVPHTQMCHRNNNSYFPTKFLYFIPILEWISK